MQDYAINDFSGGYMTNAAYHAGRQKSAQFLLDCRSQEQGWLIPRKGYVSVSSASGFTDVFVHKNVLLAVQSGALKWARIPGNPTDDLSFNDFAADGYSIKDSDERVIFHTHEDDVYISTGDASFVVKVSETEDPSVRPFYLEATPTPTITYLNHSRVGVKRIDLKFQAIYVDAEQAERLPTRQGSGIEIPILAPRAVLAPASDRYEVEVRTGVEIVPPPHPIHDYLTRIGVFPNPFTIFTNIGFRVIEETPLRIDVFAGNTASGPIVRTLHDSLGDQTTDVPFEEGDYTTSGSLEAGDYTVALEAGEGAVRWQGDNDLGEPVAAGVYTIRFRFRFIPGLDPMDSHIDDFTMRVVQGVSLADFYRDADPDVERTAIRITLPAPPDHANFVDVYASNRENRDSFYWIARMPYVENEPLDYVFAFSDPAVAEPFIDAGEQVDFQYIATSEFRTYIAAANSDKVYMSYYNPANPEALRQNFVDVVRLQLNGGAITGLHFLRDTFLYAYATNQIQVIGTDPIAELHRVVDYIKPRDEKGEIVGCAAPDTITNIVGRHYFLATNQRVYRFDGQRLYDVSDRVHGAFEKVLTPIRNGLLQLQDAIGYSVDENYVLSARMAIPDCQPLEIDKPNRLLVYDVTHGVWWHDSYGIHALTKGVYDSVYGVIDGKLYLLHYGDTDNGACIKRLWRGHPYQTTTQKTWESVHVHPLGPGHIDIKAATELEEFQGYVEIRNIASFDEKRMGCNLRGAVQTVEIETESAAAIHRIAVNERPRNR